MRIARHCPCCGGGDLARSPAVLMPFIAARVFGWESVAVTPDWGLRDLKPGWAHSLCATLACDTCGLLFLDMRFDEAEISALYTDYRGPAYTALRESYEPGYNHRNSALNQGYTYIPVIERLLESYLPQDPRILDWGGDTGLNTPFRGRCSLHHVFDVSGKPLVAGAERVDLADIGPASYDLVVAAQVLEHVPEPSDLLLEMRRVVGPETLVYIEVPHEPLMRSALDPEMRRKSKRHWHEHINFFTEAALHRLLERSGFSTMFCRSHAVLAGEQTVSIFSVLARPR
jgi:SAM-dependent methyltransferase